jgi:hypothetical protein
MVTPKFKAFAACALKGLYKTANPKTNRVINKVPVKGFFIMKFWGYLIFKHLFIRPVI